MILDPIRPWKDRLRGLTHSHGTFSKMIQDCMLEEITELRKQNRHLFKRVAMTETRVKIWQGHTRRYQKLLGEKK